MTRIEALDFIKEMEINGIDTTRRANSENDQWIEVWARGGKSHVDLRTTNEAQAYLDNWYAKHERKPF